MTQPPTFLHDVYSSCPDNREAKEVFLHAAEKPYNSVGDRHVLILWCNAILEGARVSQIIQLTGQAGNYQYYSPLATAPDPQTLASPTKFSLGCFTRHERDIILRLACEVKFSSASTRNGCLVWTRDLLLAMVSAGLISQAMFNTIDSGVPLMRRVAESYDT